jgi:transcriptional regulator with XRE-family HTH domain
MSYQPQRFTAPDGTEMVVLRADDWERLRAFAEDEEDVREATATMARIEAGEGTVPGEVVKLMIVDGLSPLASWRRHRGLSQAALARKAGLSQVWVSRIEAGGGYGSRETRRKLAAALEAPVWALEDEQQPEDSSMADASGGESGRKSAKYQPLQDFLRASGKETVSLTFDQVARMVGGLPKSAGVHRAWWGNHEGNSQAKGWMGARYLAEPNPAHHSVTFRRFSY